MAALAAALPAVAVAGCGGQPAPLSAGQILRFDGTARAGDVSAHAAYGGANG